jgi:hypothetical protein
LLRIRIENGQISGKTSKDSLVGFFFKKISNRYEIDDFSFEKKSQPLIYCGGGILYPNPQKKI